MGILTHISDSVDVEEGVQRIFVVTRFSINNRSALNRVASRAALIASVGQRTLVASAYDELGIDMVWREGPVSVMSPEEKWPRSKEIDFHSVEIEKASEFFDITNIPRESIPRGRLADKLLEGLDVFRQDSVLYVWEIPIDTGE